MKKLHLLAILIAVTLCSCVKHEIITTETVVNMHVGETYQLKVECDMALTYICENDNVATVSVDGLITAIRVGETKIHIRNLKNEVSVKVNVLREDGQYHPTKKISKIYKTDDYTGEKHLLERWIWENNNLVEIVRGEDGTNNTYFHYNELGQVIDAGPNCLFFYGANGLEKIVYYIGTWIYCQVFYHYENGILSEVVLNNNGVEVFPEDGEWFTNKLTWENGNVIRVDTEYRCQDETQSSSLSFIYDDKANPFCGFPYPIKYMSFDFTMLSANNCIEETSFLRYTYTYDGDYPISMTDEISEYYYEYE